MLTIQDIVIQDSSLSMWLVFDACVFVYIWKQWSFTKLPGVSVRHPKQFLNYTGPLRLRSGVICCPAYKFTLQFTADSLALYIQIFLRQIDQIMNVRMKVSGVQIKFGITPDNRPLRYALPFWVPPLFMGLWRDLVCETFCLRLLWKHSFFYILKAYIVATLYRIFWNFQEI